MLNNYMMYIHVDVDIYKYRKKLIVYTYVYC